MTHKEDYGELMGNALGTLLDFRTRKNQERWKGAHLPDCSSGLLLRNFNEVTVI